MKTFDLNKADFETENVLKEYLISLVFEYASIMNQIESDINTKSEKYPEKDFFPEFQKSYFPIFEKFCSDKRRVYGGKANAYGSPTKFDGIEKGVESSAEIKNKNRAEVYIKTQNDFDAEYLFVLVRQKSVWRIDNAKSRWYEEEKWDSIIL